LFGDAKIRQEFIPCKFLAQKNATFFANRPRNALQGRSIKSKKNAKLRRKKGFLAHTANQDDEQPLALGRQIAQGRPTKIHKKAPDRAGRAPDSLL